MLIVGLGNPGRKYEGTRHNIGFSVVDEFVSKFCKNPKSWSEDKKLKSLKIEDVLETKSGTEKFLAIKPQTFMNLSGTSVYEALKWMNADTRLLVVYDDLDFPCGTVKLKFAGSAGGHNGIADIISRLGSDQFFRLRVGIGHPRLSKTPNMEVKDWVLTKPYGEDLNLLGESIKIASEAINLLVTDGEGSVRKFLGKDSTSKNRLKK